MAVSLRIDQGNVIRDAAFDGRSCVLATASASLMTELLVGKTPAQAKMLFQRFHALAAGDTEKFKDGMDVETARMTVLSGVHAYPVRMRCATLAWKTMLAEMCIRDSGWSGRGNRLCHRAGPRPHRRA